MTFQGSGLLLLANNTRENSLQTWVVLLYESGFDDESSEWILNNAVLSSRVLTWNFTVSHRCRGNIPSVSGKAPVSKLGKADARTLKDSWLQNWGRTSALLLPQKCRQASHRKTRLSDRLWIEQMNRKIKHWYMSTWQKWINHIKHKKQLKRETLRRQAREQQQQAEQQALQLAASTCLNRQAQLRHNLHLLTPLISSCMFWNL